MKLTNISLAILVAIGVAACGGSGDNNSPVDPPKPNPNNNNNSNNNNKPTPPDAGTHVVDPTGTQVVDDKDLTKQNTVGTLQYIRRDGSQYDRTLNPSKPASASPLLGTTLNDQNPSLTNIVLARQEIVRADGTPVKAQFAGSDNPMPLKANGDVIHDSVTENGNSLQQENFANVDVLAGLYKRGTGDTDANHADDGKDRATTTKAANNIDLKNKIKRDINSSDNNTNVQYTIDNEGKRYVAETAVDNRAKSASQVGIINDAGTKGTQKVTAIIEPIRWETNDGVRHNDGKDAEGKDIYRYIASVDPIGTTKGRTVVTAEESQTKKSVRYGYGLAWWSSPENAFENHYTHGNDTPNEANRTTGATPTPKKTELDSRALNAAGTAFTKVENGSAATNGLVRVGGGLSTLGQELNWNKDEKKWENHHNTTTRIFGRYHLAYAGTDDKNKGVHPVALNSFKGAKTFVAEYEAGSDGSKPTRYSIGAEPTTLKYVQYGRVSTQLDVDEGVKGYADNFIRNPYKAKNADDSVDDYFYRGTNATTIEQMAALPSDQKATYQGHALMYGIDNDFHNAGKRNLPNAFAGKTDGLGLGNFVEATADFSTKRLQGNVYNEWLLDPTKSTTTRDNLVAFQGNIVGNTVVGTADRTYLAGDDKATFKASFFGEKAEELGGSFNSVKDADKYGSAYGENDWGGVFGATRGGTSNTFQGDDSNNVYGSQQNGQQP